MVTTDAKVKKPMEEIQKGAPLDLSRGELTEPVNRLFILQEYKGELTSVDVLDKHVPVGVLRGLVVDPKARLLTHESYLAIHLLKARCSR